MRHKYVVAVYEINYVWGGPEEGGWWYNEGERIRIVRVFGNEDDAMSYADRFNKKLDATLNKGRPHLHSVLSYGRYQALVFDDDAPPVFPTERPHYC